MRTTRTTTRRTAVLLVAGGLVLVTGCGDEGTEGPDPGPTTTTVTTASTTTTGGTSTTSDGTTGTAGTSTTSDGTTGTAGTSTTTAPVAGSPYMDAERVAAETSWSLCSATAAEIFAGAGTRDPAEAAEWYGRTYAEEVRPVVVAACRAGLQGDPLPSSATG